MRLVPAIIKPAKLENVCDALAEVGFVGITTTIDFTPVGADGSGMILKNSDR